MTTSVIGKNRLPWWEFLLMGYFAAYFLTPFHMDLSILPFLAIVSLYVSYIFIFNVNSRKDIIIYFSTIVFISILYFLLTDTKSVQSESFIGIKRIFSKIQQFTWMFFPLLLSSEFIRRASKKQIFAIEILIVSIIIFIIAETLIAISLYPDITRAFDMDMVDYSAIKYVGTYYFVYLIPFLIVIVTFLPFRLPNIFSVAASVAINIFLFYFIIQSQFTLALLISFIGVLLVVWVHIKSLQGHLFFVLFLLTFSMAFLPLLNWTIQHIQSEQMVERLTDVYMFFDYGESNTQNLGGRMSLYKDTILAFAEKPFFGNRSLPFDGHATLLTILSDLGLLGGIPLYFLLFHSFFIARTTIKDKKAMDVFFIVLLLMGFTNPIHSSTQISFGIWFIAPLTLHFLSSKAKKYEAK
ncbi:MAG: hypothetical protein J6X69_04310 [Bacteroidales bacterium]|nr:hypothetical protein [Bacteroidales bacterium]